MGWEWPNENEQYKKKKTKIRPSILFQFQFSTETTTASFWTDLSSFLAVCMKEKMSNVDEKDALAFDSWITIFIF